MINKEYLPNIIAKKYPAGPDIYYECLVCGDSVPSMPKYAVACKCTNVVVDADAGRIVVNDLEKFKAFTASQER